MKKICEQHNGEDIIYSYDPKERAKIFLGRKKLFPALSKYDENLASTALADDMAVCIRMILNSIGQQVVEKSRI